MTSNVPFFWTLTSSVEEVQLERNKVFEHYEGLCRELQRDEDLLHSSVDSDREAIVSDAKMLGWMMLIYMTS